ncbi:MAG TPA: SdiA-regulated domain-containing protein [Hanamia sp.]|nr:SdiA-regulated domain-containing protein [Hanamia sp.]
MINMLCLGSCAPNKKKLSFKDYDLHNPYILILNDELVEISGICYYPKDTSVFAISDESGNLFKIHLGKNIVTQKWRFDKKRDFEDLYFKDSTIYVLESNGNIYSLNFSPKGDTIYSRKSVFPNIDKKRNEFESLYYDDHLKTLVMICKNCEGDKKNSVTASGFDPETGKYTFSLFTIDAAPIAKQAGKNKIKLQPSGAAVNPLTKDLWILCAVNHLIVVTDNNGIFKEAFHLDQSMFTQPEGIAFTPAGDLLISNEAGNKYNRATLFIFKHKKNI